MGTARRLRRPVLQRFQTPVAEAEHADPLAGQQQEEKSHAVVAGEHQAGGTSLCPGLDGEVGGDHPSSLDVRRGHGDAVDAGRIGGVAQHVGLALEAARPGCVLAAVECRRQRPEARPGLRRRGAGGRCRRRWRALLLGRELRLHLLHIEPEHEAEHLVAQGDAAVVGVPEGVLHPAVGQSDRDLARRQDHLRAQDPGQLLPHPFATEAGLELAAELARGVAIDDHEAAAFGTPGRRQFCRPVLRPQVAREQAFPVAALARVFALASARPLEGDARFGHHRPEGAGVAAVEQAEDVVVALDVGAVFAPPGEGVGIALQLALHALPHQPPALGGVEQGGKGRLRVLGIVGLLAGLHQQHGGELVDHVLLGTHHRQIEEIDETVTELVEEDEDHRPGHEAGSGLGRVVVRRLGAAAARGEGQQQNQEQGAEGATAGHGTTSRQWS